MVERSADGGKQYDFANFELAPSMRTFGGKSGGGGGGGGGGGSGGGGGGMPPPGAANSGLVTVGRSIATETLCSLFDIHEPGVIDTLRLLATNENDRYCALMPSMREYQYYPEQAVKRHGRQRQDQQGNDIGPADPGDTAEGLSLQPFTVQVGATGRMQTIGAHEDVTNMVRDPAIDAFRGDAREDTGAMSLRSVPFHGLLDRMHARCRLPVRCRTPRRW